MGALYLLSKPQHKHEYIPNYPFDIDVFIRFWKPFSLRRSPKISVVITLLNVFIGVDLGCKGSCLDEQVGKEVY
ncbi:hypothetical protein B6U74_05660 [Candidatus Bathyarchaeota archaeon ex4484_205]|nr:MAG: hypothetical protein B6U74_05660 [Candidatus Bathyarchaeota archaeon ex4484_205]